MEAGQLARERVGSLVSCKVDRVALVAFSCLLEIDSLQGIQLNVPVLPSDTEQWLWQTIAHGAKGVWFFSYYAMNQGYEAGGYGLVGLDGKVTDRARVAGKIASIVSANPLMFQASQPVITNAAILYNPASYLSGGNTIGTSRYVTSSLMGVYRSLFTANIPVDFIHSMDIEKGKLMLYRILYLPFAITLSQNVGDKIKEWVHAGGKVISEARLAWTDSNGFATEVSVNLVDPLLMS